MGQTVRAPSSGREVKGGAGGRRWLVCLRPLLLTPPPALERSCLQQPLDCDDIYAQGYQADGVYLIYPSGPSVPVPVFCDMTTEGGKWTVSGGGGTEAKPHSCEPATSSLKQGRYSTVCAPLPPQTPRCLR